MFISKNSRLRGWISEADLKEMTKLVDIYYLYNSKKVSQTNTKGITLQ